MLFIEGSRVLVPLSHQVDIAGFHHEATRLLALQVAPETVQWSAAPIDQADAAPLLEPLNASIRNRAARAIVPQSFVRMSELVVLHRDASVGDFYHGQIFEGVRQAAHAHAVDLMLLRYGEDGQQRGCTGYLFVNPLQTELESFVASSGRRANTLFS